MNENVKQKIVDIILGLDTDYYNLFKKIIVAICGLFVFYCIICKDMSVWNFLGNITVGLLTGLISSLITATLVNKKNSLEFIKSEEIKKCDSLIKDINDLYIKINKLHTDNYVDAYMIKSLYSDINYIIVEFLQEKINKFEEINNLHNMQELKAKLEKQYKEICNAIKNNENSTYFDNKNQHLEQIYSYSKFLLDLKEVIKNGKVEIENDIKSLKKSII